jgi:retron-type reverse transcriptase
VDQLLYNLFKAYYDARQNKRNTINQLRFELNLERNLFMLYQEIKERKYAIMPSIAFVVFEPVQREIFAADFRDRVIHHLVVNYLEPLYEPMLIVDSCSCRKGKGTLFGVNRVKRFMQACSDNYTRDCYILKLDIKGYFMSMRRTRLYEKMCELIEKGQLKAERQNKPLGFEPGLVKYLLQLIIFNDPRGNCIVKGKRSDWDGLPPSKSLFNSPPDCGFPIGNLTSQVFSNVYLHELDCFIKYTLKMKYYSRYVDDFIIIHEDKQLLLNLVKVLREFLATKMGLELHPDKVYLQHYTKGVQFLNAYIKPHRTYIRNRTKAKAYHMLNKWNSYFESWDAQEAPPPEILAEFRAQINSYLGFMIHQNTYNLRRKMLLEALSPKAYRYLYAVNLRKMVIKKWAAVRGF